MPSSTYVLRPGTPRGYLVHVTQRVKKRIILRLLSGAIYRESSDIFISSDTVFVDNSVK